MRSNSNTNPFGMTIPDIKPPRVTGIWYAQNESKIKDNTSEVLWLELQLSELKLKKASLKKPRGMKGGIIIFSLFSIANIIYPLSIAPFYTCDYNCFLTYKILVIGLFALGIASIIVYLALWLRWKNSDKK